ncbi:BPSL0067 family protein, partial [Massilia sp. CCM 9210]|uniref:BPSL0067 family protein n=1 Tax=Massilia scottii TaxID=3057166 RepID=UPI002796A1CC
VNYGYNGKGQVTSITLNPVLANGTGTGTENIVLLNNITYAPFGGTTGWTWGNSVSANEYAHVRSYDLDGRISSYTLGSPSANGIVRTLNYDAASRIKGYTHTGTGTAPSPASLNQTFGYDELNRLTSYNGNGTSQTYAYDASGNRIKAGFGANSYTNTIDPLSNKLSATTGPGPAKANLYNGAGDLMTDGTHVVTYSGRGRPYRNQNGAVTTHQLFNGLDQRVFQTYGGGIFVYDEQGQLVGEYSYLNGKVTRDTVYLGNLPVAVLTQTVTGTAPAQNTAINVFHIHPDHLGTPRMITRTLDNKIVWRWDNGDPFGLTPPTESFSGSGTFTFNLRMPGQYYDRSTNLFHNYHRDYDPQTGRYIQSDPIGLGGGVNTYAYVEGNPLFYSDPYGLNSSQTFNWGPGYESRIYKDYKLLVGEETYKNKDGKAECVELVKQTVGGGRSSQEWRQGPIVDKNTPPGTAVGNFNKAGKFDTNDTGQHGALLYTAKDKNGGIIIVEQYKTVPDDQIRARHLIPVNATNPTPSNNAKDYNVILFPKKKK